VSHPYSICLDNLCGSSLAETIAELLKKPAPGPAPTPLSPAAHTTETDAAVGAAASAKHKEQVARKEKEGFQSVYVDPPWEQGFTVQDLVCLWVI